MSMYTQLLTAALGEHRGSGDEPTTGEKFAELLWCRSRLGTAVSSDTETGRVSANVGDQLAYDIALIAFARHLGIDCDLRGFDQPQHERNLLARSLLSRGIRLDNLDE